jgi:hypothetical protein
VRDLTHVINFRDNAFILENSVWIVNGLDVLQEIFHGVYETFIRRASGKLKWHEICCWQIEEWGIWVAMSRRENPRYFFGNFGLSQLSRLGIC